MEAQIRSYFRTDHFTDAAYDAFGSHASNLDCHCHPPRVSIVDTFGNIVQPWITPERLDPGSGGRPGQYSTIRAERVRGRKL